MPTGNNCIIPGGGWGVGTAIYELYGLYGYVPLRRVWFSSSCTLGYGI